MPLSATSHKQPYVPPPRLTPTTTVSGAFQRSLAWLRRSWLWLRRLRRRTWCALVLLTALSTALWLSLTDDPVAKAETACNRLRESVATLQAALAAARQDFPDRSEFHSLQQELAASGSLPNTQVIHDRLSVPLERLARHHDDLGDALADIESAARTAARCTRRLAQIYDRVAQSLPERSALQQGYALLAADARADSVAADDFAQAAAAAGPEVTLLKHQATALVRFFADLQSHVDRRGSLGPNGSAYRLQISEAMNACQRLLDTLDRMEPYHLIHFKKGN